MQTPDDIYSVSRLNREVRELIEYEIPAVTIEGEISNLARPASGHLYFSLKDEHAQVRCAMFRGQNRHLTFRPGDGTLVLARARVSLYEARGDFQLIVDAMEEAGDGALRRAFEQLKNRLAAEGLFADEHKQTPPRLPGRIGVITSPSGAALHDILSVLGRRFPSLPVLVYPTAVQGESAAGKIAQAIELAGQRGDCDVLILARGGGSLEDLWSFNEEIVARAIYACPIPVVAGVGHETDITIADFVADRRAPTPSAAAELVAPDRAEWLARVNAVENRLLGVISRQIRQRNQALESTVKRLQALHPGRQLRNRAQRVDEMDLRLRRIWQGRQQRLGGRVHELSGRLLRQSPDRRLGLLTARQAELEQRLHRAWERLTEQRQRQLAGIGRALDAISPLGTLSRGYAIVKRVPDGQIVRSPEDVEIGQHIQTMLAKGSLTSTITEVASEEDTGE